MINIVVGEGEKRIKPIEYETFHSIVL